MRTSLGSSSRRGCLGLCRTLTSLQLRKLWGEGQPALRDRRKDRLRFARLPPLHAAPLPGGGWWSVRDAPGRCRGLGRPHARCLQKQILTGPVSPVRLCLRRALLPKHQPPAAVAMGRGARDPISKHRPAHTHVCQHRTSCQGHAPRMRFGFKMGFRP